MNHPLWTLRDDEVGAYYEERVLAWLGWDLESAPVNELASAYRQLSEQLNRSAGAAPSGEFAGKADLAVRALVYGWRSVFVARRLLRGGSGVLVELGSGLGPFGLVAGAAGRPVRLVDAASKILDEAPDFFAAFDVEAPTLVRGDMSKHLDEGGEAVLPYSALEWAGSSGARRDRLVRAFRSGRLLIVERGTKEGGAFVQGLRDGVQGRVGGPCPERSTCALVERPKDWCHFTWSVRPGPLTQRISDKAGRRWNALHVSWVRSGSPGPEGVVLWKRPEGKRKLVVGVCTSCGLERWVAERRDREATEALEELESGDRVRREGGETRGDGVRVRSHGEVRRVAAIGDVGVGTRAVDDL